LIEPKDGGDMLSGDYEEILEIKYTMDKDG